jgi:purine-binding chemotaxis protein CheW
MKENDQTLNQVTEKSGKFLTFSLNSEEYGLEILKLKEIMGITTITPIPQTPDFVKGVINLRDKVIPIIDLRLKFEMPQEAYTDRTCIIVVEAHEINKASEQNSNKDIGVVVDSVSEVMHIKQEDIEAAPSFGGSVNAEYILGMAKVDGGVKILLDIDSVLSDWKSVLNKAA